MHNAQCTIGLMELMLRCEMECAKKGVPIGTPFIFEIEVILFCLGVTFGFFAVAILCSCTEFFFDAEKLVVFSHTVRT